jgi:hypothetical protein
MEANSAAISTASSSPGTSEATIWSRLIELMSSFDSQTTKIYVRRCIALAERLVTNTEPVPHGVELVGTIQNEMKIPGTASELPPVGVLGLCVNVITIVRNDSEDPMEFILNALILGGVEAACFPGAYERESERLRERNSNIQGVSMHRF